MPRPRKNRKVCALPKNTCFGPRGGCIKEQVSMAMDEYEAIRLIDYEGLTQEECASQMEIARTTVQSIYSKARKKLAKCIVDGESLHIGGGNYRLCGGTGNACGKTTCCKEKGECKNENSGNI